MASAQITELTESNICKICDNALARYSCPRCTIIYCSLNCYRSDQHLECSEELAQHDETESSKIMQEILRRNQEMEEEELDSDDEDDGLNMAERLSAIRSNKPNLVWEKPTDDEIKEVIAIVKSGDVTRMVASWEPWWRYKCKMVEELDDEFKAKCPKIGAIRPFKTLSSKEPADCVNFNLINVLGAYSFTCRYFNGEYMDFVKEAATCAITISKNLQKDENFEDFKTALKSVEINCTQSDWIIADLKDFIRLHEDIVRILGGPSVADKKFYILSALSDLKQLLFKALTTTDSESLKTNTDESDYDSSYFKKLFRNWQFPNVKFESKSTIKNCLKKIDYLLAYTSDFDVNI